MSEEADTGSAPAIRRAALRRLLSQPTATERRPCRGCTVRCRCERASTSCCCGCSSRCELAPALLGPGRPVHPVYAPILYSFAALRVFSPYWSIHELYCRFPTSEGPILEIRAELVEYVDLLSHHLAYLFAIGALAVPWRVALSPHLSGSRDTTFAIEPLDPAVAVVDLEHDLLRMAESLPEALRRLARARLFRLTAPASSTELDELSPREAEVLDLLLSGLGVAAIAQRLFISPHTVRNHIKHICAKLEVSSQRELRELFAPP